MGINNKIYHMNAMKIRFTLMFMEEGSVLAFKESHMKKNWIQEYSLYIADFFKQFKEIFWAIFQVSDIKAMALIYLLDIKQALQPLDTYIITFMNGINQASLTDNNMAMATFFT
ncbi:hypothetical protein V8B97DRAFT_2012275 [Scleroderma yunnanense]